MYSSNSRQLYFKRLIFNLNLNEYGFLWTNLSYKSRCKVPLEILNTCAGAESLPPQEMTGGGGFRPPWHWLFFVLVFSPWKLQTVTRQQNMLYVLSPSCWRQVQKKAVSYIYKHYVFLCWLSTETAKTTEYAFWIINAIVDRTF